MKHKVNVILSVFKSGAKLKGKGIYRRIHGKGYKTTETGVNHYSLINKYK